MLSVSANKRISDNYYVVSYDCDSDEEVEENIFEQGMKEEVELTPDTTYPKIERNEKL